MFGLRAQLDFLEGLACKRGDKTCKASEFHFGWWLELDVARLFGLWLVSPARER